MKNEIDEVIALWRRDMTDQLKTKQPLPALDQLNKVASLFASGEHFYFIFSFFDNKMEYVHPNVEKILGITPDQWTERKFLEIQTPESLEMTQKKEEAVGQFFYGHLDPNDIPYYKASYFVTTVDSQGREKRILHQSTAITVSEEYRIERVFCIHTDVSHLKMKKDDSVTFISLSNKPSYYNVDPVKKNFEETLEPDRDKLQSSDFTSREREIIEELSKGGTAKQIAENLGLTENTVRTHRQKILEKANCHNTTQLVSKCLVVGII